jgi:YegS/Rv2252/BmrU family lipid kinase
MSSYNRALIIINPVAGQHDPDRTESVLEHCLEQRQIDYDVRRTSEEGDAEAWAQDAADQEFDLVVVAGGDGTVMEAVSGLVQADSRVPLAQIPVGTANLFARALGISTDVEQAADTALSGPTRALDVGYLPDRETYFALMVGAGYDARLVKDASRELKNWLSFFAYIVGGIKNLFTLHSSRLEIEVDGEQQTMKGHTVLLLNVGRIGETIEMDPRIRPTDGKLDLAVISSPSPLNTLFTLFEIVARRAHQHGHIEYLQASNVRFAASPRLPIHIDGELTEPTPLSAEVIPEAAVFVTHADYDPEP